jgi:2-polyprenyl-3-methyl-5-hydroxy-6-metoxy-1,4-benzoquinol methylase
VIESWSQGDAANYMNEEILVALAGIIGRHPWWQARGALTLNLLARLGVHPPAQVLDAGCGWGVTLDLLERSGYRATGMDISRRALEQLNRPDRLLIEADLARPFRLDAPQHDAVLALDVIEHLNDDRAAIERLASLVRPGGVLVVSVPARPELFTEFDVVQGHRRRYLPETLRAAFAGSTLGLEQIFWWGRWLVPTLRRQRARQLSRPGETPAETYKRYLKLPPWPLPSIARMAFRLERDRALQGVLKTGTSLFAVARRPLIEPTRVKP